MRNNIKTVFHFLFGILFLVRCGMSDKTEVHEAQTSQNVTCADRNVILFKNESTDFHFNVSNGSQIDTSFDPGNSLRYLDWGVLTQTGNGTAKYSAPNIILEARKISAIGTSSIIGSKPGQCSAHVLDDFTYGVTDDGNTKGLIVTSYETTDITKLDTFPPKGKGVIRDVNFISIPSFFSGVSTLSPEISSIRMSGTLNVPGGNYWFRFTCPRDPGNLFIDGVKVGTSDFFPYGEIPRPNTPQYNTGISLSPGKHKIQIDIRQINNTAYILQWTTTKPTANANTYVTIPPSAFDRD